MGYLLKSILMLPAFWRKFLRRCNRFAGTPNIPQHVSGCSAKMMPLLCLTHTGLTPFSDYTLIQQTVETKQVDLIPKLEVRHPTSGVLTIHRSTGGLEVHRIFFPVKVFSFAHNLRVVFRKLPQNPSRGSASIKVKRISSWSSASASEDAKPVAVIECPQKKARDLVALYGQDIDFIVRNRDLLSRVVLTINSPGGSVTTYGYLYEQTKRLREANLEVNGDRR